MVIGGEGSGMSLLVGRVRSNLPWAHTVHKEMYHLMSVNMFGHQSWAGYIYIGCWGDQCGLEQCGTMWWVCLRSDSEQRLGWVDRQSVWCVELAISLWNSHVMDCMKQVGGRMDSWLWLGESKGWIQDKDSALVFLEPDLYESVKLNWLKNRAQQVWHGFMHFIFRYTRFLWLVKMVNGWTVPSNQ